MKIRRIDIHNFRSVIDASLEVYDYTMLVGANNAGKSTIINALRVFYDDVKWSSNDFPKIGFSDEESWISLTFELLQDEWDALADKYNEESSEKLLTVRRYLKSTIIEVKPNQSNIYAIVNGQPEKDLFYGAKNVGTAKVGSIIYIPALTTPSEQLKTTGPSPLRNMLNFMLKRVVSNSQAYQQLNDAFGKLNDEARDQDGFLSEISKPINKAIEGWNIKLDMSVNPVNPEEISKSLVKYVFVDEILGDVAFDLDRYGHGFQRSFIYEIIKIAPSFKEVTSQKKKEFNPDFTLLLFEEPEAFLHPGQQENMAYHLRKLGSEPGQQVIVTTHSTLFVGKVADEIGQIIRIQRHDGVANLYQPKRNEIQSIFEEGFSLIKKLQEFVDDSTIDESKKKEAKKMLSTASSEEIALDEEKFRYQLWLDSDRSAMFFADRVLLVEGPTEKAFFNYMLARDWHDLAKHKTVVIDAIGKYNFHRFLALFAAFGIPHGVMLDDDDNKDHHKAINDLICESKNDFLLGKPVIFNGCFEKHLGLLESKRDDKKPLEILKAVTSCSIKTALLDRIKSEFMSALGIHNVESVTGECNSQGNDS